jgi:predicted protein tyrosine phosphatase
MIGIKMSLSDEIKQCRAGVARNPFQGKDKKVLFVCSMGILRSATAARIYAKKYNTRSAGTWREALVPLTPILIAWADEIVFVNRENFLQALDNFGNDAFDNVPIEILNIPDQYEHMHPKLIEAFNNQYEFIP